MANIVTLNSGDLISNSRADINTSLANLNSDKIETSVIDTDTALTANSDAKIPSQKAVKAYIDTQGGANASETVRGVVEEATDAEVTAGTATGATGAKLIVTPAKLSTRLTTVLDSYMVSTKTLFTYQPIDGSTTPQAVFIASDGFLVMGDANVTELDTFNGFVFGDYSAQTPAVFLNSSTQTTSTSF